MATQRKPDLQESTAKQNSAECILGVNKIAPKFITLVATHTHTHTHTHVLFGSLKTSQRNIYICHSAAKG